MFPSCAPNQMSSGGDTEDWCMDPQNSELSLQGKKIHFNIFS